MHSDWRLRIALVTGLSVFGIVAAQAQDVGVVGDALEQLAVRAVVGLADVQVADGGDAQLLGRAGLQAGLGGLGIGRGLGGGDFS